MMTDWEFLTTELATLEQAGLLARPRTVESAQGAWMTVDGKRVFNLCSNNYLGLANPPRLREAAHAAIERFGVGPAAVRSIAGTLSLHHELEHTMVAFKNVENATSARVVGCPCSSIRKERPTPMMCSSCRSWSVATRAASRVKSSSVKWRSSASVRRCLVWKKRK
jgi:hypothetical protein